MSKGKLLQYIFSLLLTILLNQFICMVFDYSQLMPFYMFIITVGLESLIVYQVTKRMINNWNKMDKYAVSILYFCFILAMLMGRYGYQDSWIQLNPLACLREFYYGTYYERMIFAFNIVSFIPIPIFIEVFTRNIKSSVVLAFLFGLLIEILQVITHKGIFDLGDLTLYCVGICIGYVYMKKTEE